MGMSKSGGPKLRGLALEQEVVKLRLAGAGFELIARNLGCSVGGAHGACMRAIDRKIKEISEGADKVLTMELERLDSMLLGLWPKAAAGNMGAIDKVLRIMDRRAKYLGLDAPQRLEHTGSEGGPIQHEYDFSHLSDDELERQYAEVLAEAQSVARGAATKGEEG